MRDIDPLQVSEVIAVINETLDSAFPIILVEGEISSFKINQGKFVFYDVKDETGSLACFMMAFQLKFPIEDGMKVRILAQPKITAWGKFSLTVREVMPVGEGSLKKSFELLKATLEKEGLFDELRKRPIMPMPKRIGVVSSSQAAGFADFIKILQNRWGGLEIILVDVPVQGMDAPAQIVGALAHLNELPEPLDVIAVIRGGGSADDLSAFNHEDVVRAVALSRTPVLVGVGHEVDTSLSDLAADRRAATPSNAAELLVPDKIQVLAGVKRIAQKAQNGAEAVIRVFEIDSENVLNSIDKSVNTFFVQKSETLKYMQRTLHQLDPQAVLKRGYSLAKKGSKVIIKTSDVILGDEITVQLSSGELGAKITYVSN